MEGISREELRIQYETFELKPTMGFQILLSNVAFLYSKGSSNSAFILKCNQKTPNGIVILTVKTFMVNNYTSLSNSIELYENQIEMKYISEYIQGYDSFCFNKQDEVMNYIRKGYYRYNIDQMYKINSSFKGKGVLSRFELIKSWITQLLEAISLLHEKGFYHGGLKASNIFIDESNNKIRITDFGFNTQQVTMMHYNISKEIYISSVMADRANTQEQRRFNDVYALIILLYQMCFGFDNTFYQIKQLQQGITFNENDDERDLDDDDYEYKFRIIKLINKIVSKAALGTEEQRKKITVFYISDVLQFTRNVESFQNSPKHIADTLNCDFGQQNLLSSEKPHIQHQQQDYTGDSKTDLEQEELYIQELLYQQQKRLEEEKNKAQKQIYTDQNVSLQQKINAYKKLDYEKYQKHSDSQKSSSNNSSEKKNQLNEVNNNQNQQVQFNDAQLVNELSLEKQQQLQQSHIDTIQQEEKLNQILKQYQIQQQFLLNQESVQYKEINLNSVNPSGENSNLYQQQPNSNFNIEKLQMDQQVVQQQPYTFQSLPSIIIQPPLEQEHQRTSSYLNYDQQVFNSISIENPEKNLTQLSTQPNEPITQQNDPMNEQYEDFWVIDLSHKTNVQRGADYHPKKYNEQVKEVQLKQKQIESEDIYTLSYKNGQKNMSIQQTLLKQIESFDNYQKPENLERDIQIKKEEEPIQETSPIQDTQLSNNMSTQAILSNVPNTNLIKFPNGAIQYEGMIEKGMKNGFGILYDHKGQKIYEGLFKDDIYNGQGVEFYENGQILHSGNFEDGQLTGFAKTYYKSGALCYEGEYLKSVCHGQGTKFDEFSSAFQQGEYSNGKMIGIHKKYFQNGQVQFESNYKNNKRDGKSIEYHPNGQICFEGTYKNGKKVNGVEYDLSGNIMHQGDYEEQYD